MREPGLFYLLIRPPNTIRRKQQPPLNLRLHRLQLLHIPVTPHEPAPQKLRLFATEPDGEVRRQFRFVEVGGRFARSGCHGCVHYDKQLQSLVS